MAADTRAVDRHEFLSIARAALATGDAQTLADEVSKHWSPRQLCRLMTDANVDVRRVAAVTLGLVGDATCVGCLARALHDADENVNAMAEHGLWSIWFRSGQCCAVKAFTAGIALMEQEAYAKAILKFREAATADPTFAEAFHQCSLASFLLNQWEDSIAAAQRAVALMPAHFGAMAGMGHAHLQLGEVERALCCYRRALAIHPRLSDIRDVVARLEASVQQRNASSVGATRS